ncbi:MAG: hypothetical protein E7595_01310 [Ruminococcaceae bacterium]|nr:hypothetical protein [Oscillospiraceae bacterium]
MNNKKNAAVKDNRRYKYGSLSIVFTVVFIALIIAFNLVMSSLSLSGNLTVDLTKEEYTNISDETMRLLGDLGKDLDITVTFMSARDKFDLDANTYKGINLTGIIRDLVENYSKTFDGSGDKGTVRVQYKEINTDPEFEKKYLEESTTVLTGTSVIVQGKHHYRVLDLSSFFTMNESGEYHSFNGEYRLTTAILQASITEPQVVTITYDNGEPAGADGVITVNHEVAGIKYVLEEAGFEVKTANLESDDIDDRTKILITYKPTNDLTTEETDKISKYLKTNKAYMVFVDAETPELPNLQSMLNDYWGINYKPFHRITDDEHSLRNNSSVIKAKSAALATDDANNSAAYQIRKTASELEGNIAVAMANSVELIVRDDLTKDAFTVEKVFTTYETAESYSSKTGTGNKGEMPLMLLSTKHAYGENNVSEYGYVMLCSSTDFASSMNLIAGTYGNKRVFLSAARVFGADRVAPDIDSIPFGDTALTIEKGTAKTLTWIICTLLPGAVIIFGIVVFFRRRHL